VDAENLSSNKRREALDLLLSFAHLRPRDVMFQWTIEYATRDEAPVQKRLVRKSPPG
jgi:hypothetical protein